MLGAAIGAVTTVALIVLLVCRELVSATPDGGTRQRRALDRWTMPLLLVFATVVAVRVAGAL
jgi:hypothetical protein